MGSIVALIHTNVRIALRFDQVDRRFNWQTGILLSSWITTFLAIILHH